MKSGRVYSILILVVLAGTLLVVLAYTLIALNPYSALNPFPPEKAVVEITDTPKDTPIPTEMIAPTWTPKPTATITPTPPPSFTPTITKTPEPLPPTRTSAPTATMTPRVTRSPWPFTADVTYDTPFYGCSWQGVAGIVQDLDGNPLTGYAVHIWGGGIDVVLQSGSKTMYGDSGFEQFFSPSPMEVNGVFRAQLHSPYGEHRAVSEEVILNYEGYCSTALANITFIQNH